MLKDNAFEGMVNADKVAVAILKAPQREVLPAAVVRAYSYPIMSVGACYMLVTIYPRNMFLFTLITCPCEGDGVNDNLS